MAMSVKSGGGGGRGRGRRGKHMPMSEINVTPMVDVMLVLLIIFMVAAPLLQTGIDVNLRPRLNSITNRDGSNRDRLSNTRAEHRASSTAGTAGNRGATHHDG